MTVYRTQRGGSYNIGSFISLLANTSMKIDTILAYKEIQKIEKQYRKLQDDGLYQMQYNTAIDALNQMIEKDIQGGVELQGPDDTINRLLKTPVVNDMYMHMPEFRRQELKSQLEDGYKARLGNAHDAWIATQQFTTKAGFEGDIDKKIDTMLNSFIPIQDAEKELKKLIEEKVTSLGPEYTSYTAVNSINNLYYRYGLRSSQGQLEADLNSNLYDDKITPEQRLGLQNRVMGSRFENEAFMAKMAEDSKRVPGGIAKGTINSQDKLKNATQSSRIFSNYLDYFYDTYYQSPSGELENNIRSNNMWAEELYKKIQNDSTTVEEAAALHERMSLLSTQNTFFKQILEARETEGLVSPIEYAQKTHAISNTVINPADPNFFNNIELRKREGQHLNEIYGHNSTNLLTEREKALIKTQLDQQDPIGKTAIFMSIAPLIGDDSLGDGAYAAAQLYQLNGDSSNITKVFQYNSIPKTERNKIENSNSKKALEKSLSRLEFIKNDKELMSYTTYMFAVDPNKASSRNIAKGLGLKEVKTNVGFGNNAVYLGNSRHIKELDSLREAIRNSDLPLVDINGNNVYDAGNIIARQPSLNKITLYVAKDGMLSPVFLKYKDKTLPLEWNAGSDFNSIHPGLQGVINKASRFKLDRVHTESLLRSYLQ